MDVLHLALYAVASLLALRSLTSLMSSHRARYAHRRVAELSRQPAEGITAPPVNMTAGKPAG